MPITINPFTGREDDIGVPQIKMARAPTTADYQYSTGQQWVDTSAGDIWFLASVSGTTGTWEKVVGGTTGVTQLDSDSGSANPVAGIINVVGTSAQGLSSSATGNTLTFTIADATTSQKGVGETATDAEAYAYSATDKFVVPANLDDCFARPATIGSTTPNTGAFTDLTSNGAFKISDTNDSNWLTLVWNENDTSDRTLNFLVNSGDRSVSLSGNLTVEAASTINQDVTTDNTPTFTGVTVAANTGNTQTHFSVTPNTAIAASQVWKAFYVDGTALDPSGASSEQFGLDVDFTGVSLTNDPELIGARVRMPTTHSGEAEKAAFYATGWGYVFEACSGDHDAALRTLGKLTQDFDATSGAAGQELTVQDVIIQTAGSTGGEIHGMDVAIGGAGSVAPWAVGTHPGVGVIHQHIGTAAGPDYAWVVTSGPTYTDRTTEFGSGASDVQIFVADNDEIMVGGSAVFDEIQVILDTVASQTVIPTFYYSIAGPSWTQFTPSDDTSGFTQNGSIRFDSGDLSGWAATAVNGQTYYWIRIVRTRNNIVTPPTEDTIKIVAATEYYWDSNADLLVRDISARNFEITGTFGLPDTDDSNHLLLTWNENDSADRTLNFLVASGNRSVTLNENFTVGDGTDVTIQAQDAAGTFVMDNANFEAEHTASGTQRDIKIATGTDANATLTIEGTAGVIDQDLTQDASPTFAGITTLTDPLDTSNGGTGVGTFTSNGVLYGNAAGDIQVTAQGAANTVLTANAGAPSFSATPTVTSITATTGYITTLDTNVAAAGMTIAGTTITADGTDTNIDITVTPKGTGVFSTGQAEFQGVNGWLNPPTYMGTVRISGAGSGSDTDKELGLEFLNSTSSNGYGWRIANADYGSVTANLTPLIFEKRTNATAWTEFARFDNLTQTATFESVKSSSFDGAYSVPVPGGWVSNLGITYSSSTLTVTSADGTALSTTNPGYVIMRDRSSPGLMKKYTVTADQDFIDDTGSSEIVGNLFGLTTSIAATVDMPFFIYAVTNDDEDAIAFMCSRVPAMNHSPASANIGDPSAANADVEIGFFSFEDITEADYDDNPCIMIGSFRMQMSASDDWTVQALDEYDGIGLFNENRLFATPPGQFGADSGTYTLPNGGTSATFGTKGSNYLVYRDGSCLVNIHLSRDGGTDGSGAVDALFQLPYSVANCLTSQGGQSNGVAHIYRNGGNNELGKINLGGNSHSARIKRTGTTINDSYQWEDFGNGNRRVEFSVRYAIDMD